MQYIEDIWPKRIIDDNKFRTFLELCKIRDEFLKSLTTTRYCDYLIDKKLVEAGGLGKKIYIYAARGSKRNILSKQILEFLEEGRDVTIMNARDAFTKLTKPGWYNYLNDRIKDKLYEEFAKQLAAESPLCQMYHVDHTEWKPIVRPDAYAYSNNYMYNNFLWGNLACNIVKDSIFEIIDNAKGEYDDSLRTTGQ